MIEVEQNIDFLNSLAEDGINDEGDANRAWAMIAQCIDDGTPLPSWILAYLRFAAERLMDHDANSPSDRLAHALKFHPDKKVKPSKSTFDMLEIASTISNWRRQDVLSGHGEQGMDEYYGRYIVERLTGKESLGTIKSLYYKGLEALLTEIDQNRRLAEREE